MTDGLAVPALAAELEGLRARLAETEEVLRAIGNGEVDAVVVAGERGEQVYTLSGADRTYRQLIETMSEGAVTLSADGVILYCNARLAEMLGRPLGYVMGSVLRDYLPPADEQALDAVLAQARTMSSRREINLKTSEGRLLPVHLSATHLQSEGPETVFCLVLTDLTEQKRYEHIVEKERLAQLILEQAAEAIVVCDEQGRVIRASQAAQRYCAGGPLLRRFAEVFPLRTDAADPFDLAPVLQGETLRNVDVALDGPEQQLDLILNAGPLVSGPHILGCVVTLTNITARKRAEEVARAKTEEVRTMTQELWQVAKLATVGELAASIAHELNNPLATIILRVESLLARAAEGSPDRQALNVVSQEAERMAALVASLLQSSCRNPSQISSVDVCQEIVGTLELIHYHLRNHRIAVATEFAPGLPMVQADRQQLRQVFLNLFTNAGDAMPQGGTLTLRAKAQGNGVVVEFVDTGTGIRPEDLPRAMEPFFTTKGEGKGTGLGLAICRRIVQEFQGSIGLASVVGEGAVVRIELPAANGTTAGMLKGFMKPEGVW